MIVFLRRKNSKSCQNISRLTLRISRKQYMYNRPLHGAGRV